MNRQLGGSIGLIAYRYACTGALNTATDARRNAAATGRSDIVVVPAGTGGDGLERVQGTDD